MKSELDNSLNSISPIDGRYHNNTIKLSGYFSEKAFIRYRIIVNNTQKNFISKSQKYEDRYKEICKTTSKGITLKKWRPNGNHIIVIPPSYHTAKWYGIDRVVWESDIVAKLKRHTDREIRVRHKYIGNMDVGNKVKKPLDLVLSTFNFPLRISMRK